MLCYLFCDYLSYQGGTNNLQVVRLIPVSAPWGYIKMFTSQKEQAKKRARAWAKKNGLRLVGE